MILDGICYPVILYVWSNPSVVSLSRRVPCYIYEYFPLRASIDVVRCVSPSCSATNIRPPFHRFKTDTILGAYSRDALLLLPFATVCEHVFYKPKGGVTHNFNE